MASQSRCQRRLIVTSADSLFQRFLLARDQDSVANRERGRPRQDGGSCSESEIRDFFSSPSVWLVFKCGLLLISWPHWPLEAADWKSKYFSGDEQSPEAVRGSSNLVFVHRSILWKFYVAQFELKRFLSYDVLLLEWAVLWQTIFVEDPTVSRCKDFINPLRLV